MTKHCSLIAIIVLFLSLNANAQIFWKISGNGLTKPSYLFGTHHLIEKDQIKNFDKALALCKDADVMVGEIDMTDMSAIQLKMTQGCMLTGTTCKELMSADDYALADKEFKQLMGIGLDQLGVMKPMMLNTLYTTLIYCKTMGLSKQPEAVDLTFQKTAKENGKKVLGLETVEQEMDVLFNNLTPKRQAEVLIYDLKGKEKGLADLKKLTAIYLAGDMKAAQELDKDDDSMTPEEKKPLIEGRNNNWMKEIPALIKAQQCFIAVGFLHLTGETGLINQLKKAGYKVEAVTL